MTLDFVVWLIAFVLQSALLGKSMFTASGGGGACHASRQIRVQSALALQQHCTCWDEPPSVGRGCHMDASELASEEGV